MHSESTDNREQENKCLDVWREPKHHISSDSGENRDG